MAYNKDFLNSQAFLANVKITSVDDIQIDKKYYALIDAYFSYPSLQKQIEHLIKESFHPYRNDQIVLEELKNFFLNNLSFLYNNNNFENLINLVFELIFNFYDKDTKINIKVSELLVALLYQILERKSNSSNDKRIFIKILINLLNKILESDDHTLGTFTEN